MSGEPKRVILGSDAVRALLFHGHARQAEFVAELEVASSFGYTLLYPTVTLDALRMTLGGARRKEPRRRLKELTHKLDKGSFIGHTDADELEGAFQLLRNTLGIFNVEHADVIALSMAIRRDAAILTKDESFLKLIAHSAPKVRIPPFRQTLEKTIREAKPM